MGDGYMRRRESSHLSAAQRSGGRVAVAAQRAAAGEAAAHRIPGPRSRRALAAISKYLAGVQYVSLFWSKAEPTSC